MNYEILNIFDPNAATWPEQKERLNRVGGKLITLQPDPGTLQKQQKGGVEIINVIDFVTKRVYHPDDFMFFNQAPVVDGAEIFMNEDRTIDVIKDGDIIGAVETFPNSRRLVRRVTYYKTDRSIDFVEEFSFDGSLYSRSYYAEKTIQQIVFYNNKEQPVVTFYFYDLKINLVTIEDVETRKVIEKFGSIQDFFANTVPKIVNKDDKVTILYMGIELNAISLTDSNNSLFLVETPTDENGKIRGNLEMALNNEIQYLQNVYMTKEDEEIVKENGISSQNISII